MSKQDYALVYDGAILSIFQADHPLRNGDFSDEFPADSQRLSIIDVDAPGPLTDRCRAETALRGHRHSRQPPLCRG
jgi:hypothetical protein